MGWGWVGWGRWVGGCWGVVRNLLSGGGSPPEKSGGLWGGRLPKPRATRQRHHTQGVRQRFFFCNFANILNRKAVPWAATKRVGLGRAYSSHRPPRVDNIHGFSCDSCTAWATHLCFQRVVGWHPAVINIHVPDRASVRRAWSEARNPCGDSCALTVIFRSSRINGFVLPRVLCCGNPWCPSYLPS